MRMTSGGCLSCQKASRARAQGDSSTVLGLRFIIRQKPQAAPAAARPRGLEWDPGYGCCQMPVAEVGLSLEEGSPTSFPWGELLVTAT